MKFESVMKQFVDVNQMTRSDKVICSARYEQNNPNNEAHLEGEVLVIFVNDIPVANIRFGPGDPKVKSVEVDVTEHLTELINSIGVQVVVDKDFLSEGYFSEALFRVHAKGERVVKIDYISTLPLRITLDNWLVPNSD